MKTRSCKSCMYVGHVCDGKRTLYTCTRTSEAPGRVVRVRANGTCAKFRRQPVITQKTSVPEQPTDKDMRYVPLTKGKVAIVDTSDYDWLSLHNWHVQSPSGRHYAARRRHDKIITMHREIMLPLDGYVVDHIDGDGLNNRRSNLRICTRQQNYCNRAKAPGCSSQYKGVHRHVRTRKYHASIRCRGERTFLGAYDDEIDAARAYDCEAVERFGPYAWLNFPEEHGRPPHRQRLADDQ